MEYCLSGFNGKRPDPLRGHYHPGNGYRAYSPAQGRFTTPDSWSPFGPGGINPYAYCVGDPVNRADPSGHFSLGQGAGMALGFIAGVALSILTEGAAMPVALTLMAMVAGDAAIGAGAELATEAIDGQRISWSQVGMAAGLSAGASLAGLGLGKLSKLKGISNRPFGGMMLEGTSEARIPARTARTLRYSGAVYTLGRRRFIRRAAINEHYPRGLFQRLSRYEEEAHEVAMARLQLPARRYDGVYLYPLEFGQHRQLLLRSPHLPIYSRELRQLAPLPENIESDLTMLYDMAGVPRAAREYSVSNSLPVTDLGQFPPPPPRYSETDPAPLPEYTQSGQDELLDYHYMTHL